MAVFVGNSLYVHAKEGCYSCGRGDGLVSTEIDIEGEGVLVFCRGCILDLARACKPALDLVSADVVAALEEQATTAWQTLETVRNERDELQGRLNSLREEWVLAVEQYAAPAEATS